MAGDVEEPGPGSNPSGARPSARPVPDYEIRELDDKDIPEIVGLLAEGFPRRTRGYWQAGLRQLADRDRPASTEKYGYGLASDDGLQGVVLTIPSIHAGPAGPLVLVNISSWYARPAYRGTPAKELYRHATRRPEISYTNLSAVPHTIKTITSFGFREWTAGQVIGATWHRGPAVNRGRVLNTTEAERVGLTSAEATVLREHEAMGCLTLCLENDDRLSPMVFIRRRIKGLVPAAQLIYCQDVVSMAENGRAIWAWLARRGHPLMLVDASGPLPGLAGRYVPAKASKYIKGPLPVAAVDHTYSEMVLLGF